MIHEGIECWRLQLARRTVTLAANDRRASPSLRPGEEVPGFGGARKLAPVGGFPFRKRTPREVVMRGAITALRAHAAFVELWAQMRKMGAVGQACLLLDQNRTIT